MIRPDRTVTRLNPTTLRSSLSSSSEDRHTPPSPKPPSATTMATANRFQRFVGPASLVGGTAAIYTSLLQHPNSTLTRLSFVYLMLLAVQYAVQPRLSKRYISPKINKQSVALVEEVVKTGLAAAVFCSKPSDVVQGAVKGTFRFLLLLAFILRFLGLMSVVNSSCLLRITAYKP